MENKIVITIARQSGSGGREVGKELALELGIPFYDRELIALAAKKSGVHEDFFENMDENAKHTFVDPPLFSSTSFGNWFSHGYDMPMNDKLFLIQSNIIQDLAATGSCVIVGRGADYVLENHPDLISIFIHANQEDRLKRIVESYGIAAKDAKNFMAKTDKNREAYYNYYANGNWGRAETYDLAIDSSTVGIHGTVTMIKEFIQLKASK